MKSILHITFAPITDYLGHGLQLNACIAAGFNVKVINVSALFNFAPPLHSEKYAHLIVTVKTFEELEAYISEFSPESTILSSQITFEWRFRKFFRLIARMNQYRWCIFLLGQLPFHSNSTLFKKILSGNISKLPSRILLRLLSTMLFWTNYFKSQSIIFYAGENIRPTDGRLNFPINYFDYDSFLESPDSVDERYIVFLDEALFQHPDDALVGNRIPKDALKNYQRSLNAYFDFLENSTGLKVIVAAHPKSNYREDFFKQRTVIKHKTSELVKKSSIVLIHCSTSISYAVCYRKPILFLSCNEIIEFSKKNQPLNEYINNFARHLERPVINTDSSYLEIPEQFRSINIAAYEKFETGYLTTRQTNRIQTKDVIVGYLNKILASK